jgi:hypothetical protein
MSESWQVSVIRDGVPYPVSEEFATEVDAREALMARYYCGCGECRYVVTEA